MKNQLTKTCLSLFVILSLGSVSMYAQSTNEQVIGLDRIFELADEQSQAIKSAKVAIDVADAAVAVSKNAILPEINFSASATYNGNAWMADRDFSNSKNLDSPHFGNNFALEVAQVVYAGGAIKHNIKASQLQAQIARHDLTSQRQKVRFLLTGYYLNLYKFRNMLKVYDRNIERTKQVIADMKAKVTQGIALDNDITRYEVQLQNLLYRRTELLSSIDVHNNYLVTTLNLAQGTQIMPDTTLLKFAAQRYTEAELQNLADANSPILQINQTNIDLNRHRQKIAKAGLLPKVSLIAGDNLRGPITFEMPPIDKNLNTWFVGIGLSYNIGNLYKSPKEIKRSKFSVALAQEKYAESQETVALEVHQAYTHYMNAFELLRTQEKSLQLATENYAVIENRYNNDLVLLIDLLDADNIKLDAEIQYVNARINIIYNYYKLLYVTGTL